MIAIIYPQNLFQLLRIPWSFILEWKIWIALVVTKEYEYTVGISRGKVDPRFASWKIGPLNQARWLTLAIRLMCLWTRGAYPQNLSTKLYSLINFIVNIYAICWFDIKKVTSSITSKFIFTIWLTGYESNQLRFKGLR